MGWDTKVRHVEIVARACADSAELPDWVAGPRVRQMWAVGEVLGRPGPVEWVTVALSVDLPAEDVPWWSVPPGAQAWADRTRVSKYPILCWWRSMRVPVWNHRIVRPLLVWDVQRGVIGEALDALREGRGAEAGLAEPSPDELRARLDQELAISLAALQARNSEYEQGRFGHSRLAPLADQLWHATNGYLDLLAARDAQNDAGAPNVQRAHATA